MMRAHLERKVVRGFTLIELAVVVAIVGVLATALLHRAVLYQEQAEKVAMEQMLGTLRSALHLQIADLWAKGNMAGIERLSAQNPMDWLGDKPSNYTGEYYSPKPEMIEPGNWYYDRHGKELVYVVNNADHLHTAPGELHRIRFRVKLLAGNNSTDGALAASAKGQAASVVGVILDPVVAYSWL